mmetsp:Transcript_15027/g.22184  ORF Transcript_15027/g.22184 Transcript_15027/m.22184 type:complete len:174 (-) Transcript_15027:313-834(-)
MGKKSRRPNRNNDAGSKNSADASTATAAAPTPTTTTSRTMNNAELAYPSDGPSEIELLQTTSATLQMKLDQLIQLARAGDRSNFVKQFVPLDLSPNDTAAYLADLTTEEEAESQWTNLIAEIAAIAAGRGVDRIEGDQIERAVFYFKHPLYEACDREVSFVCSSPGGEWRAEG